MMASGVRAGQLTARKVKNMVAELDEKLSDSGGRDVEDGGQDSHANSDESGSDADDVLEAGGQNVVNGGQNATAPWRPDSRGSLSSVPSVTSHYSDSRGETSSATPDNSGGGGGAAVDKQLPGIVAICRCLY